MSRSPWRMAWVLAGLALALMVSGQPATLSASCGPNCEPSPAPFTVPAGKEAFSFRIVALQPGRYCSPPRDRTLAGFSIRRGGQTVFVYYQRSRGPVSDPVPLDDLVLHKGHYELLAVPASGAFVRLAFELREAPRP